MVVAAPPCLGAEASDLDDVGEEAAELAVPTDLDRDLALEPEPEVLKKGKKELDFRRTKKLKALLLSKYDSVLKATEALGWVVLDTEEYEETHAWNVCWSDVSVSLERVMRMGRMQKINHFPGMLELVRKAGTARNLNKMLKHVGKDYKFFPKTFMLPADYTELKKEFGDSRRGAKTFIVKPSRGCQGTGITLTRCLDDINPNEPNIVQRYMHRPHLLDGYKYDLRLYVLLTSIQPVRIFLFREGLVRICTEKYVPTTASNLHISHMHLTNYAINKDNPDFVQPVNLDDDESHKRTISSLMNTLRAEGHDVEALWDDIGQLCVKTIISVQPHLEHTYFSCRQRSDDPGFGCFELLGFDVMLDWKLRPYLLEVNHSPSFTCDSPLDDAVKSHVLASTMELVSFSKEEHKVLKRCGTRLDPDVRDKLCALRDAYETQHCERCGFQQICPPTHEDAERAAALLSQYRYYLSIAAQLYGDQSLRGSRRATNSMSGTCRGAVAAPKDAAAGNALETSNQLGSMPERSSSSNPGSASFKRGCTPPSSSGRPRSENDGERHRVELHERGVRPLSGKRSFSPKSPSRRGAEVSAREGSASASSSARESSGSRSRCALEKMPRPRKEAEQGGVREEASKEEARGGAEGEADAVKHVPADAVKNVPFRVAFGPTQPTYRLGTWPDAVQMHVSPAAKQIAGIATISLGLPRQCATVVRPSSGSKGHKPLSMPVAELLGAGEAEPSAHIGLVVPRCYVKPAVGFRGASSTSMGVSGFAMSGVGMGSSSNNRPPDRHHSERQRSDRQMSERQELVEQFSGIGLNRLESMWHSSRSYPTK